MSRKKYGNPKKKSRFICLKCLKENDIGNGIQRGCHQREMFHIKDLYCIYCKDVTKNMEIRYNDFYQKILKKSKELHSKYYNEEHSEPSSVGGGHNRKIQRNNFSKIISKNY